MRHSPTRIRVYAAGILIFLCLGTMVPPMTPVASAQSYPLVCRGGGPSLFIIETDHGVPQVVFYFAKGNAPAGFGTALAPGACSWVDRGINEAEPGLTCAQRLNSLLVFWSADDSMKYFIRSDDAPYLKTLLDPTKTFIFKVHHAGYCLQIDGYGP